MEAAILDGLGIVPDGVIGSQIDELYNSGIISAPAIMAAMASGDPAELIKMVRELLKKNCPNVANGITDTEILASLEAKWSLFLEDYDIVNLMKLIVDELCANSNTGNNGGNAGGSSDFLKNYWWVLLLGAVGFWYITKK